MRTEPDGAPTGATAHSRRDPAPPEHDASAAAAPADDPLDTDLAGMDPADRVAALAGEQPRTEVRVGDVRFTLLGTAHVSRTSARTVARLVAHGGFDAVAIELDEGRFAALTDADRWAKMDLFRVFREGKAGMVAANLALGAFQQRLAGQLGIEPGAEMKAAIDAARTAGVPLLLVDRDIGVTLRRVYANVPWWQRLTILSGLLASVVSREEISEEEIERLKDGDMLEATFNEFAERSERLYTPLIAERDAYMAARLRQEAARAPGRFRNALVVLGAGHLKGVRSGLADEDDADARVRALAATPKPRPWGKIVSWAIVALIVAGFALGFARSPDLGLSLLGDWFLINGVLAGLGAALALAHPLTVLVTAVAAPLTSLNPLIGAGFVAAGVELWLRKPQVGDFAALRTDVTTARGWWRNRVARTLLVFLLATVGSALGTYLAGFRIFGKLFG